MKPGISSRLTGVKYRLAGFSLRAAKYGLQQAEKSLRRTCNDVNSIELSHKKLLNSSQLAEKLNSHHSIKVKQMESLRQEVESKKKEFQKKATLEEQWRVLHDETRGNEIAVREALQAEDLIESYAIRTAIGPAAPLRSTLPPTADDSEAIGAEDQPRSGGGTNKEDRLPVITELVEGRVLARLDREGSNLCITLITHSFKDQQLLNHFRRKYARIVERDGARNASIKVERRKR